MKIQLIVSLILFLSIISFSGCFDNTSIEKLIVNQPSEFMETFKLPGDCWELTRHEKSERVDSRHYKCYEPSYSSVSIYICNSYSIESADINVHVNISDCEGFRELSEKFGEKTIYYLVDYGYSPSGPPSYSVYIDFRIMNILVEIWFVSRTYPDTDVTTGIARQIESAIYSKMKVE